jgi:phosphatidylglycerophosphate synthase
MWVAHALTLSRIPLAVALWWAYGHTGAVVAIIALAALTDTLDGNVARAMKRRGARGPDIGGWLDPLVDKLFVITAIAVIWFHTQAMAVLVLIGARELVLLPLLAVYLGRRRPHAPLRADVFGKAATVAQFVALAVVLAAPAWALPVAIVTAVLGLVAVTHYAIGALR